MDKRIKKIDPTKMIEVSGFRMDSKDTKSIPYVKSEMFLTELMEEICKCHHLSIDLELCNVTYRLPSSSSRQRNG